MPDQAVNGCHSSSSLEEADRDSNVGAWTIALIAACIPPRNHHAPKRPEMHALFSPGTTKHPRIASALRNHVVCKRTYTAAPHRRDYALAIFGPCIQVTKHARRVYMGWENIDSGANRSRVHFPTPSSPSPKSPAGEYFRATPHYFR